MPPRNSPLGSPGWLLNPIEVYVLTPPHEAQHPTLRGTLALYLACTCQVQREQAGYSTNRFSGGGCAAPFQRCSVRSPFPLFERTA